MVSAFVIKVKFGNAVRRINVDVDENNEINLNMVSLTSKIRSIFKSSAYKNLNLTYVDEDGDMIYLVDDDDLHDAMRQPLKFLIIDVHENGLFPFQSSQCFPGLVCSVIFFLFIKAIKVLQN
ncbi:unnamed protein product [Lathyrus oleraceus]|uniref:PB1 domain-containing protein n=1 Tax=Pisum sativum TaxID=3888 RepID=A0A9D4X9W4_PEA|nr:hypothetical protein KIW84_041913 [Pisum sativum]